MYHTYILEPCGRNSTAAIASAALFALSKYGADSILLILPADHVIHDTDAWLKAVNKASQLALNGKLVTFGIKPDSPSTAYGYIEADGFDVKRFIEKPGLEEATQFLSSGDFHWNSGMFCMTAGTFMHELETFCPDIADSVTVSFNAAEHVSGPDWSQLVLPQEKFSSIRDISVDYAIMQQSSCVAMVACEIGWSDIGSWTEFAALNPPDQSGNHVVGSWFAENHIYAIFIKPPFL